MLEYKLPAKVPQTSMKAKGRKGGRPDVNWSGLVYIKSIIDIGV